MIKRFLIFLLKLYKKFLSPYFYQKGIRCKYYPTCSEYMVQAIEKYGPIKGVFLGVIRLFKCNPFSKGGFDPLK